MTSTQQIVIKPRNDWKIIDWRELREYRDLFRFLVWRGLKSRYAQSALGIGWAVIQPVFTTLVFTVVFGNLAKMGSENVSYPLWSFTGVLAWTYFANSVGESTNSLIANAPMIGKIYFPRMILPLTAVISKLVDFAIACIILAGLMIYFETLPTWNVIFIPLLVALMMITSAGVGMWLTSLAIQYRDIKHASTFLIQLLMYASPVVYATAKVPEQYRIFYAINPMVGVIEGFRSALLGTREMPWNYIIIGTATSLVIAITGALYFNRKERIFADVA